MSFFDLKIGTKSSDFGPESDDVGHRVLKLAFLPVHFFTFGLHKQVLSFLRSKNMNLNLEIGLHTTQPYRWHSYEYHNDMRQHSAFGTNRVVVLILILKMGLRGVPELQTDDERIPK